MAEITKVERIQIVEMHIPKPMGTNSKTSIYTWQKGYLAAIQGQPASTNPYMQWAAYRQNPGHLHYKWWLKGYNEGIKAKEL